MKKEETTKLFNKFQSIVKETLHTLYLRDVSSFDFLNDKQVIKRKLHADLPYFTKHLLVAAFIASYNPPRLDQRFFTRGGEGRKKVNGALNGSKMRQQLLGPKVFGVERMLAIFFHMIEDKSLIPSFDIYTQVFILLIRFPP